MKSLKRIAEVSSVFIKSRSVFMRFAPGSDRDIQLGQLRGDIEGQPNSGTTEAHAAREVITQLFAFTNTWLLGNLPCFFKFRMEFLGKETPARFDDKKKTFKLRCAHGSSLHILDADGHAISQHCWEGCSEFWGPEELQFICDNPGYYLMDARKDE